jgi:hypothetical protein
MLFQLIDISMNKARKTEKKREDRQRLKNRKQKINSNKARRKDWKTKWGKKR